MNGKITSNIGNGVPPLPPPPPPFVMGLIKVKLKPFLRSPPSDLTQSNATQFKSSHSIVKNASKPLD